MAIVASQLVGKVEIQGADQAKSILLGMSDNSKKAQDQLNQLQNAAKDAGSILASRFSAELKNAQGGLQDLGKRASDAGLDVSKFTSLQQKASEAAARLGVAQAQAAAAQERANAITNEGSASAEQIALAQAKAALAAENVQKAEMAAADAMSMVQGEATRLADALEMAQSKGGLFSGVLGGLKTGASGFFGAIAEAPGKLMEATQKIGLFIFGVQQIIQTGQQVAGVFVELGKKAGDFQEGITQLSTGAGELNANLGLVSAGLLKMAPEVGESTKELEDGMYLVESAGQHGAKALQTLKDAAEGAKVGNAALKDVANGVTTEMTDYAKANLSSAEATNTLIAAVSMGKTQVGALSAAMSTILPTSAAVGVSLGDTSAAMATMTSEGTDAASAATYLRQLLMALEAPATKGADALKSIGLSSQQVADEMKISLPATLQMITDHLKNKFPEGSAAYVAALKDIAGGSRQMQGILELTGDHLQTFKDDVTGIADSVKKGGNSITGWSKVQEDFNFQMQRAQEGVETLQIKLGTKLFPVFSQVFGWVSSTALPALSSFSDWFFDKGIPALQQFVAPLQTAGQWFQNFVGHGQAAIPILAGIGAVIATLLVPAVWSLATGVIAATWPFLAIGLAVGGLTAVFLHFYNTNAGFKDFINGIAQAFGNAMDFFANKAEQARIKVEQEHVKMAIAQDENTAKGAQAAINNIEKERQGILQKLKETHDPAEQSELQHQLKMTDAQAKGQEIRLQKADEDKKKQLDKQKELHDQMLEAQKPWYQRMWDSITGFFGGVGKWFQDRFNDAKNGITSAFGTVGKWFGDRWHDIQNVFGGIGQWFQDRFTEAKDGITSAIGGIGKWFQDRWNEIATPLKPLNDYLAAVFQTLWNILVALFMKLGQWFNDRWEDVKKVFAPVGQWFHDRWTEAWNATTAVFSAIGKWFGDRWVDVQNIFKAVGAWFHDRWSEAWAGIVAFFGPIGKWFQDRWVDTQNVFKGVGKWFHDRFSEAWNGITSFFAPIGKWFSDRWNDVMGGVNAFKKSVTDKFGEVKTGVTNIFHDMINGIVDKLNDGIGAVESFVNFFGQALDDIAKGLGTKGTIPMVHLGRIPHYAQGTPDHPGGPAIVGERGPELVFLPKGAQVAPNHITEMLLGMTGGKIPGYADGIGDLGSKILGWLSGGAKSILDNVMSTLNITAPKLPGMENLASAMFNKVKSWALSWVDTLLPKFDFGGVGGQPVNVSGTLKSWIAAAMALTHVPGSWAGPLATIAQYESGGNPNAQNNWDINAQRGDPSRGLFQTIGSTFRAYALPGYNTNIFDPVSNAAAAIMYIKSRYGDVFHVPGIMSLAAGNSYVGYANGGVIQEPIAGIGLHTGTRYAFGERGKELVTPFVPSGVSLSSFSGSSHMPEIHIHNHHYHHLDGKQITGTVMTTATKTSRRSGPIRS